MILEILIGTLSITCLSLGLLLYIATKKLILFDDIFDIVVDDIDINFAYLDELIKTPLFENSPEVLTAHKNMEIIHKRLEEIVLRVEEMTGKLYLRRAKHLKKKESVKA